VKTWGD